jgi:DNA-binding NarL/FixJ family response regulator
MINVILADDHAVVRTGMRRLLDDYGDIMVVAEAENGDDAYTLFLEFQPDVLILDMDMPDSSGLATLARLIAREPSARVLMFSSKPEMTFAVQAISAGAKGYILKSSSAEDMVFAIRQLSRGKSYLSPEVAQEIAIHKLSATENPIQSLTPREFEIFRLLAEGEEVDSIAERLKIGHKTVANYQTSLKQKLNISTPIQLVRLALKHRVISLELALLPMVVLNVE